MSWQHCCCLSGFVSLWSLGVCLSTCMKVLGMVQGHYATPLHERNSNLNIHTKGNWARRLTFIKGIGNSPQLYQASHNKLRKGQSLNAEQATKTLLIHLFPFQSLMSLIYHTEHFIFNAVLPHFSKCTEKSRRSILKLKLCCGRTESQSSRDSVRLAQPQHKWKGFVNKDDFRITNSSN